MSEILSESMYESYSFSGRKFLDFKTRASSVFWQRVSKPIYDQLSLKFYKKWEIADEKLDFGRIPKIRNDFFPEGGPFPWLDLPDAPQKIQERLNRGEISTESAELCRKWIQDGYVVLPRVFSETILDRIWEKYVKSCFDLKVPVEIHQRLSGDRFLGRCLNAHYYVPELAEIYRHPALFEVSKLLLGVPVAPYQTIIGFAGSEQKAHSDAIHMSTYPLGYLSACWVAFEDIHPDSGPLFYYPGSHRLPYLFSRHLPSARDRRHKHTSWYSEYYEPAIDQIIQKNNLKRESFLAKKGDVLVWHSNLIHGGSERKNLALSRKALVAHYFGVGAFCYGDRMEEMASDYFKALRHLT